MCSRPASWSSRTRPRRCSPTRTCARRTSAKSPERLAPPPGLRPYSPVCDGGEILSGQAPHDRREWGKVPPAEGRRVGGSAEPVREPSARDAGPHRIQGDLFPWHKRARCGSPGYARHAPGRRGRRRMLELRNVEVVYSDVILVLRGVSLQVPDGKIVALLGPNGAGKTTTLRAIGGLLDVHNGEITKGEILLDDQPIHRLPPQRIVRLGLGQVLEGRRILGELTIEENLRLGAHSARGDLEANLERVYDLFPALAERPRFTAGYLSGGQQQMLAIGRALMSSPRYLLLDEPSLGLAPILVQQIRDIIVEINKQGTGVLLVE